MRLFVAKTMVERTGCVALIKLGRTGRPDVVVSGNEKQSILSIRSKHSSDVSPFCFRTRVLAALNGISDRDDEIGVVEIGFAPCCFVRAWERFSGTVAQDGKAKTRLVI